MKVYVQGLSALAYYRNGGFKTAVEQTSSNVRSLEDATSSLATVIDAGIWRLGIGEPTERRPLEVLLPSKNQRSRSRAVHARVWKGTLPLTAFREVNERIYVSSPEFVFLQMATRLDIPQLAALGMELCGTYRRYVEVGSVETGKISHVTEYHQLPLSTPKRLRGFIDSLPHAPGCVKARQTLKYVLSNSASPMETILTLLLCLPRRLGGYALPLPVLNPPITFTKAGRRFTLRYSAKPDLLWQDKKLDLEYNSDEFHDESARAKDSMRRKALEAMKYEVIELTPDELLSTELLHATALRIARKMGKQIRPETEGDFVARRAELRERLLHGDLTAPSESESDETPSKPMERPKSPSDAGIEMAPWEDELPSNVESWEDFENGWQPEVEDVNWDEIQAFGSRS